MSSKKERHVFNNKNLNLMNIINNKNNLSACLNIIFILFTASYLSAQDKTTENEYGKISFDFVHKINGHSVLYDTMIYSNSAGNKYETNQVQYFISDVVLYGNTGDTVKISPSEPWHYVDKDYPNTLKWSPDDKILPGIYDSVSFIFGFSKGNNKSYMFRNPPESIMFWPVVLGGGYHYMKINVRYLNNNGEISNFNCHLGIGRVIDEQGKTSEFIHNCFRVTLPASSLTIREGKTSEVEIIMNIEKWFGPPNIIDFNNYGGIMDDQEAMSLICKNGESVFSLGIKK